MRTSNLEALEAWSLEEPSELTEAPPELPCPRAPWAREDDGLGLRILVDQPERLSRHLWRRMQAA